SCGRQALTGGASHPGTRATGVCLVPGRIPVTVVAGGSRSGKSHLVAQLRGARPAGERWAWLSNGASVPSAAADELFTVAGGCACCLAGPAFRTTLVRLLRTGKWQRLHIEVDATGHAPTLVDQLRSPPFDQYLQVTQLLL